MKRRSLFCGALAGLLLFGSVSVFAQGRGRGGGMGQGAGRPMGGPPVMAPQQGMPRGNPPATAREHGTQHGRTTADTAGKKSPDVMLTQNTHLSSRLQGLLPAGTNMPDAAKGFKNLGEFVAAVHVSHNLNIPFDQLKTRTTGSDSKSLGDAIHELRPDVNAKAEAHKAKKQADEDMKKS